MNEPTTGDAPDPQPGPAAAQPGPSAGTQAPDREPNSRDPESDGPEPLGLRVEPTGHAPVDDRLRRLKDADHLAVSGHLEVYEDVHRGLRDTLTALDRNETRS